MSEVIVIESEAFRKMTEKMDQVIALAKKGLQDQDKKTEHVWMTTSEVAKLCNFSYKTVLRHKDDIGYRSVGAGDFRFKREDVEAWISRTYRMSDSARQKRNTSLVK